MSEPIDVVIYVSGGLVQGVQSSLASPDKTLRVFTVDYDNGEGDDSAPTIAGDRASVGRELIQPYSDTVDHVRAAAGEAFADLGLVTISRDVLRQLIEAAQTTADDWESGIADGTYEADLSGDLDKVTTAIEAAEAVVRQAAEA